MIEMNIPQEDVQRVERSMRDMARRLDMDMRDVVRWTAWYVSRAAATATKIAPSRRKVIDNPLRREDLSGQKKRWWSPFAVKLWRRGVSRRQTIPGVTTLAEAQAHKITNIGRYGLAKASWMWAGKKGHAKNIAGGRFGYQVDSLSKRFAEWKERITVAGPEVTIGSKLDYASMAFKQRGRATEQDIMRRAAGAMEHYIKRKPARMGA
jgi:hypothetical protein